MSVRVSPKGIRFRLRQEAFDRLLALRGFRQADVAAALGVNKATVSRWRTGATVPGDHALRVAALLNAGFRTLFAQDGR